MVFGWQVKEHKQKCLLACTGEITWATLFVQRKKVAVLPTAATLCWEVDCIPKARKKTTAAAENECSHKGAIRLPLCSLLASSQKVIPRMTTNRQTVSMPIIANFGCLASLVTVYGNYSNGLLSRAVQTADQTWCTLNMYTWHKKKIKWLYNGRKTKLI